MNGLNQWIKKFLSLLPIDEDEKKYQDMFLYESLLYDHAINKKNIHTGICRSKV